MKLVPSQNPGNRFFASETAYDEGCVPDVGITVFEDQTKTILSKNDSPDIPFTWSLNPYRGCLHACAYCYARPSHEYLGLSAGTDFERKIVVKPRAPELLRETFEKASWKGEVVVFSGDTDCYQPLERTWTLTRRCLEACVDYRNPVGIITKSPVIERDVDVLVELARVTKLSVNVSIPFFDEATARALEPFVAPPLRRFATIERLASAGLDVAVSVSPIVPGLSDKDVPRVLEAAKEAGAKRAFATMLRLPGATADVFRRALETKLPDRASHVLTRLRDVRGGKINDAAFGVRMRGDGAHAAAIHHLFRVTARRLGLVPREDMDTRDDDEPSPFERPRDRVQLALFPTKG